MNSHNNPNKSLKQIKSNPSFGTRLLNRDFRKNPPLCQDFDNLIALAKQRRRIEQQEALLHQRIQAAIGQAQKAVFTQGYAVWVKGRDRIHLNTEAVLEKFPQLIEEFPQVQLGPRTLELRANNVVVECPDLRNLNYE